MTRFGIAKLADIAKRPAHDLRASTQIFVDLDVDRINRDLSLAEAGKSRGSAERPSPDAGSLDEVESQIVERVESHRGSSYATFIDQRHIYTERLNALDFEGRFATIRQAAPEAVSEFKAEAALGRNELVTLRRALVEAEQEREQFRKTHRISRPARIKSTSKTVLSLGVLALLFVFEVVVNGGFLAKGNEQGIVGGVVQALTFAALNILVSFLAGLVAVRQLNHRSMVMKLVGVVSLVAYLAFAVCLNLALSHYREASGDLTLEAGQVVLTQLKTNPLGLNDFNSWLFFGIGMAFSIVAMADGLNFTDPYPGYAALEKRVLQAHQSYTDRTADLTDNLRDIRDEASEAMNASAKDLGARRGEYDSILTGDSRLKLNFATHQEQIERAANTLLSIYREANAKNRKSAVPGYFSKPFQMSKLTDHDDLVGTTARDELRNRIAASQALLEEHIKAIHGAFDEAATSYREIDDLLPEELSGQAYKAI